MNRPFAASSTSDILLVTTLCFGWFILGSIAAVVSGFPDEPFTDSALYGIIAAELIFGAAALGYLRLRHYDLAQLKPTPTVMGSLAGLVLFLAATIIAAAFEGLFMGGDASRQPIDQMVSDATLSLLPIVAVSVINGLYEETFLLGFLQRALEGHGAAFAIGASLLVRMSYHLYQGPAGAFSILGFGAVLSLYFLRTRKLWPVVFAHILADLLSFTLS